MPFVGSHEDLGLQKSWMTADGRYGPYGYGEDDLETYNRSKVNWEEVDWSQLQNDCLDLNAHRFPLYPTPVTSVQRFQFRNESMVPEVRTWDEFTPTRRTAIVVRAYDGYKYTPEDMYNLRSLIVEAGLRTGGEYSVFLLVNIRDVDANVFASDESYRAALEKAGVPKELHGISVLWDEHLLRSWYPKIEEYKTEYQVFQPMQLFALHYPEFDHFWQLELDMRFLGDAGQYLDSVSNFARNEPRKQALERSTFLHMQHKYGNYADFAAAVDAVNNGSSHVWGPLRIADVHPIGPVPPVKNPVDDNFEWGVGEDADVIVTSYCANVLAPTTPWVYKDWIHGFSAGTETPRFFCPPAIMRASRALLLAIHSSQLQDGLRIPSEATLPSFALWHGLKLSYPPQPLYWHQQDDQETFDGWYRGGAANSSTGLGPDDLRHPNGNGLTWWWEGKWPRQIMDTWFGDNASSSQEDTPYLLSVKDGKVYAPNLAMHPVKTHGR